MVPFNFASTIRFLPFSRSIDYKIKPNHRKSYAVNLCVSAFVYLGWMLGVAEKKKDQKNVCGHQSGFRMRK